MYEFEFEGFSKEQCEAYLKRINATYDGNPTWENLGYLTKQHQMNVPFEDLAVYENWGTVNLEPDALFKKIVTDHRGGFCFELNGAFLLLLKGLGYDVVGCMARIGKPEVGILRYLYHRGTLVTFDGKQYYVDVGMGGPKPEWPVSLTGERQSAKDGKGSYWIEDTDRGWKMLKNDLNGDKSSCVIFAPIAMLPIDFYANCDHLINSGDSVFHLTRMLNINTPTGYVEIANNTLKITEGEKVTVREFDDSEFPELLRKYYGIEYKK